MDAITKQEQFKDDAREINKQTAWQTWRPFIFAGIGIIILVGVVVFYAFDLFPKDKEKQVFFIVGNVLSLLALAVIITQAIIYYRQWKAMEAQGSRLSEQLTEMKEQRLLIAHQAAQSGSQSITMRDQWQAMTDALERTDTLITQNKSVIEAAQRQASASEVALELTREHFALTERPALGIVRSFPEKRPDNSVAIKTVIVNSGKVYAKIISQAYWWETIKNSSGVSAGIIPPPGTPEVSPIAQSFIHINGIREYSHCVLNSDEWKQATSGDYIFLFWMKFRYMGLTDKVYTFESYIAFDPSNRVFMDCPTNNYAD